jgi:Ca-activated chloride channel family protein
MRFTIAVDIDTPIGIKEVTSSSHAITLTRHDERHFAAQLDPAAQKIANNRDFILNYRLQGDRIESGVMLLRGATPDAENFFLAMVEPPRAVPEARITPRDYLFVLDVSGSMHGYPLDTAKTLLAELIGGLRPSDMFNVLLFSGSARSLGAQSVPATAENIARALALIDAQGGGGGTELIPALRQAYALPGTRDFSRSIILVTDGFVSVEQEAFQLVRQNLSQTNLFAFGIGSSVNRHLIEGLARAGMGEPFIVTRQEDALLQARRLRTLIASPVLTNITVNFNGIEPYAMTPESMPDVFSQRPVILFGKWRDIPGYQGNRTLRLEGRSAEGVYRQELPLSEAAGKRETRFNVLGHLWARQRIAELSDLESLLGRESQKEQITRLGLDYSLLTQYTSFIAVDQQIRNQEHTMQTIKQPQPLPEGVSNSAVGAFVPSTPEPASLGAALVTLAMLAMVVRRMRRQRRHHMTS